MPTTRGRVVLVALTLFIVYFLFIASPTTQSEREYRQRTQDGLARRRSKMQGDISDQELTRQTNEKLRSILETHPYGPRGHRNQETHSAYDAVETSEGESEVRPQTRVGGRHHSTQTHHNDRIRPKYSQDEDEGDDDQIVKDKGVSRSRNRAQKGVGRHASSDTDEEETSAKDIARERLQEYLKKPFVIFSKSYCPHSARAKQLLTQIYTITPTPLIVELDTLHEMIGAPHPAPLGPLIQKLLGEITGRSTVPNIMVGMQSIGGNDLIWEMHEKGELISTVQKLGGKRITIELNKEHEE